MFSVPNNIFGPICFEICSHLNLYGHQQLETLQLLDKSVGTNDYEKKFNTMVSELNYEALDAIADSLVPISTYTRIIKQILTKYEYSGMLESTMRLITYVTRTDRKLYYIFRTKDCDTHRISLQALQQYSQSMLTQVSHMKPPGSIIDIDNIMSMFFEPVVMFYESGMWPANQIYNYVHTIGSDQMSREDFCRWLGLPSGPIADPELDTTIKSYNYIDRIY